MDQNLLAGGYGTRTFIPLVAHEEISEAFRRYFCIAVGHHFDVLYPRMKAMAKTSPNVIPPFWNTVIKQGMLSHVVHCITMYSGTSFDQYLLDIILRHYEPTAKDDDDIIGLLSQLTWDDIDLNSALSADGPSKTWSACEIRLAALASYAPSTESLEVRIPWNIPLQRLLKSEKCVQQN